MASDDMLWQPSCELSQISARAECYAHVRAFFMARQVLEVETPILSAASATDPHLESISLQASSSSRTLSYLHTSPEFPMKRLLAAGIGDIYQICKTFRKHEYGQRHNPEFSMLEWYRVGFTLEQLMAEVFDLVEFVLGEGRPCEQQKRRFELLSYRDAFLLYLNVDPFKASHAELDALCHQYCQYQGPELSREACLDLLLSHCIEPKLGRGDSATFLWAYPAAQAALAETFRDAHGNAVAKRFELYLDGLEIANGYQELTDAAEQRRRFEADNAERQALGLPELPLDERLLAAMQSGIPDCAGVALGLDRLLMVKAKQGDIAAVLAFPFGRA